MTTAITTLSLWLFLTVVLANLGFSYATVGHWTNRTTHQHRCIPIEREALLEFKKHLKDPTNRLATWAAAIDGDDCCSWYGVSCHHLGDSNTQYVTGLHLSSLSIYEFHLLNLDDYNNMLFGGKISSALLSLKHLWSLDLSYNDFGGISIPSFLGSMSSLKSLNLCGVGFGGMIPHQLGNLSNLQYLNLASSRYYAHADVENLEWISGLSSLKFLDLTGWNLNKVLNWDKVILTTLPSLLQLYLSFCELPSPQSHLLNINASSISILDLSGNYIGRNPAIFLSWVSGLNTLNSLSLEANGFRGSIPRELQNISSLQELYLGYNSFNSLIPNWLYCSHTTLKVLSLNNNSLSSFQPIGSAVQNFSSLFILDLSRNQFQGLIPHEIKNMTSLQTLVLSFNKFSSYIPDWLDGLTRLEDLNLGSNNLEGKISSANWNITSLISLAMSPQLGNKLELEGGLLVSFKKLRNFDLGGIKLKQDINQVLEILSCKLEELYLGDCQLFGNLTTTNQHFDRLMSLKYLDLGVNHLSGTLPVSLGSLEKLQELFLDDNSLTGDVSEAHFKNLKAVHYFAASDNQLKLRVSPNWIPPFHQLKDLTLTSLHIGPQFPLWLRSLKNLLYLDLSKSGISSTIPIWFWIFSKIEYLNLSHNQIRGVLPRKLSSNLYVLDLSNNSFSSSISKLLCSSNFNSSSMQRYHLQYLNLGLNHLYGEIPNCFVAWPELVVINLSNNKFSGTIPESIGSLRSLLSLHLSNNRLSGQLSQSLNECTKLITVDFGENELVGNISNFLGAQLLFGIKILILHSNKLTGPISKELCHAASLQILDLANNLFDGTIPSCLRNLFAMAEMNESIGIIQVPYYESLMDMIETALLQTKGNMLEYSTNLGFVRSLDFSNNKLHGKIPEDITDLSALVSLNLSHNALSGGIPKNIGSMQKLDSMDLSAYQFSGEIPQSISNLTFLGKLNLSQNRFSGRIPSRNQLQTFDASSFADNELCGSPLPNKCNNNVVPNDANDKEGEDDGDGMIWFYVSMAFGFVGEFWCFVSPLLLNWRWRFAYSQFLDKMWDRIWLKFHRFGMF